MSHTNSTDFYNLPQFLTGDKPAWLTDINNAFADIDTGIHIAQQKADSGYMLAESAQGDATLALTNAAAADAKGAGALASIEAAFDPTSVYSVGSKVIYNSLLYRCTVAITTPGPWSGSANWERITVDSIIPANAATLPYSTDPTEGTTKEKIDDNRIKSVLLIGSIESSYADANTIGYRNLVSDAVDITTLSNYPTGKRILGFSQEFCYAQSITNRNIIGLLIVENNTIRINSKIQDTYNFGIRVYYTEA